MVVDNDVVSGRGSAAAVVEPLIGTTPYELRYGVQPQKNIALTRNATVALATSEWLAFLDDDERVPPGWLEAMYRAVTTHSADGVLGRVDYHLPPGAPEWMLRGQFHSRRQRHASGTVLQGQGLGIGNALLRGSFVRAQAGPFDPEYGLTGGEDSDFMARVHAAGAKIVWSEEAAVDEWVDANRVSLRWLLLRALRGGQDYAHHQLAGRYGPMTLADKAQFVADAAAKAAAAAVIAVPASVGGRHHGVAWLQKLAANVGKLSAFAGMHYREYG